jgi:hypothetical protein
LRPKWLASGVRSARIAWPLHKAVADVRDVPSRRRFGSLYGIEVGEAPYVVAKAGPTHLTVKELSQIAHR